MRESRAGKKFKWAGKEIQMSWREKKEEIFGGRGKGGKWRRGLMKTHPRRGAVRRVARCRSKPKAATAPPDR